MTLDLKRVKAERIAKGLTQEEVSEKMGWKTRSPYAKRENGIVPIGADELGKIAIIFGYTENDLGIFFKSSVPKKEQNRKYCSFIGKI
ncbi:helix-turn-helix domain-containing protein [Melissococcus plutonius]|uniref:helix-turn-helix domain-containing protein n=1 Tax=Melissococcus plutonius TaxID=33970 RepID=UPI00065DDABB|nr:helix-turn-helix transcriptional regulator [Melissococcus plutonius]KMT32939.1 helix-turn-helix protein [Melissococcus plutonius]